MTNSINTVEGRTSSCFSPLHPELRLKILSYLAIRELFVLMQVNKAWQGFFEKSYRWNELREKEIRILQMEGVPRTEEIRNRIVLWLKCVKSSDHLVSFTANEAKVTLYDPIDEGLKSSLGLMRLGLRTLDQAEKYARLMQEWYKMDSGWCRIVRVLAEEGRIDEAFTIGNEHIRGDLQTATFCETVRYCVSLNLLEEAIELLSKFDGFTSRFFLSNYDKSIAEELAKHDATRVKQLFKQYITDPEECDFYMKKLMPTTYDKFH